MTWNYSMRERIRRLEHGLLLDGTAREAEAAAEKITEAARRTVGKKPVDQQAPEAESEPGPTRAQQRRAAEKKSERDRRFGR